MKYDIFISEAVRRELRERVEDLDDLRDLEDAIEENAGKPLIPRDVARKDVGLE